MILKMSKIFYKSPVLGLDSRPLGLKSLLITTGQLAVVIKTLPTILIYDFRVPLAGNLRSQSNYQIDDYGTNYFVGCHIYFAGTFTSFVIKDKRYETFGQKCFKCNLRYAKIIIFSNQICSLSLALQLSLLFLLIDSNAF